MIGSVHAALVSPDDNKVVPLELFVVGNGGGVVLSPKSGEDEVVIGDNDFGMVVVAKLLIGLCCCSKGSIEVLR